MISQKKRGERKRSRGKKPERLIAVILRNLVICVAIIAGGTLAASWVEGRITDNFWERTDISYLMSQRGFLKSERYDRLLPGGGYNYSGYFEILNKNARVIYSSDPARSNTYNRQMLAFIPDSRSGESFYMSEISNGGSARFLITQDKSSNGSSEHTGLMLIDEKRNVLYDSIGLNADHLNRRTFNMLKKNADGKFLQKQHFKTVNGQSRYLLYHFGNRNRLYHELEDKVELGGDIFSVCFAALCVILFCLRIVRMLQQPLRQLSEAMDEFGRTGQPNVSAYEGPAEVARIMETFDQLEQKLSASNAEREKLERQRQQMLTDISHDLKTPATVIRGYADALATGAVPPEDREKTVKIIQHRSIQLTELINSFFEYSKLEHPDMKPVLEKRDFCEFFREYLAGKYEELEMTGCTLDLDIPDEEMILSYDQALMKRVFENIINNAVKHNGGKVGLFAGISRKDGEIIVRLGDRGKGISEEIRKDVFSPFVVGNKARTSGQGTGLGLAIAKKIVELHGGTICLLPEGTGGWSVLFEIRLPDS